MKVDKQLYAEYKDVRTLHRAIVRGDITVGEDTERRVTERLLELHWDCFYGPRRVSADRVDVLHPTQPWPLGTPECKRIRASSYNLGDRHLYKSGFRLRALAAVVGGES